MLVNEYCLLEGRTAVPGDVAAQGSGVLQNLMEWDSWRGNSCFLHLRSTKDMTAVELILHCLMHLIFTLSPLCWFLTASTPYPGIDLNMIYFHFDDLIVSVVIYRVFFLPFPNPVIVITLSPAPAPSQRAGTRTFYHRSLDFLHHLLNASVNCIELPLVCFYLKCVSEPAFSPLR